MPYRKSKPWGNVKPPPGAQINWGDPINQQLVSAWLFNEGAGAVTSDIARNNAGALTSGVTWAPGKFGPALNFNGTGYINIGNIPAQNILGNSLTVSAWINPSISPVSRMWIASRGGLPVNYEWEYSVNGSDHILASVYQQASASTYLSAEGATSVGTGKWLHAAFVYDRAVETIAVYVNGVQDGFSSSTSGNPPYPTGDAIQIGARGDAAPIYWTGSIDNVRIWNRALRSNEIQRLYSASFSGIVAPRRRVISSASAGGFKPAWASRRSRVIESGVI